MKEYLVVATKEELDLPQSVYAMKHGMPAIVTGVGGTNIINALNDLPRDAFMLNVGYCGSEKVPVGTVCNIGMFILYHPNCTFFDREYTLQNGGMFTCFTSSDFVNGGSLPDDGVCDMELAFIAALGFTRISSVKYVSDGLSYEEYVKNSGNAK